MDQTNRHLGNTASNRAEGKHGAVNSRMVVSTGDLADVYQRILLAVDYQEKVVRHNIAYSRTNTRTALSGDTWADVRCKVSHRALKKAHEEVKTACISTQARFTNFFTSTLGSLVRIAFDISSQRVGNLKG